MKRLFFSFLSLLLSGPLPAAPADSARYDGAYLHNVTTGFETPHLDWAQPLAGGPVEALFITNRKWGAREVVELAQRIDLKFDTVLGVDFSQLTFDSVYESRVQGTSPYEKEREVAQKLEKPWPLFVLANFQLSALDERAQYRILSQVAEGSGLVVIYPWNFPFAKLFSQPTEEWRQIVSMISPTALPEREATLPEGKLVKTYRFGKGRIVVLDYGIAQFNYGLTPRQHYSVHGWKARYENALALTGRAVLWAAGRELEPGWSVSKPEGGLAAGQAASLQIKGKGTAALRLRNEWNEVVWHGKAQAEGETEAKLPPLMAGRYFLDLLSMEGKAVSNFGVTALDVASRVGALKLSSAKPSHEAGEPVKVILRWEAPLSAAGELQLTIDDLPNRNRWASETVKLEKGSQAAEFTFPAPGVPTVAGLLRAKLMQEGLPLAEAHEVVYFPQRAKDLFPAILWGCVPPQLPEMYSLALQELYPEGIATSHSGSKAVTARLAALFNQRFMPHDSIISLLGGEDGQTRTRVWMGLPKDREAAATAAAGDGSFYNPNVQAHARSYLLEKLEGVPEMGPPLYNLGDENNYTYEAGYTPSDEAAYRRLLQEWYGDINTLNREWGTSYADFASVSHPRPSEVRKNRLYPHWYAHRRFMERQYADAHHFMADQIRELDPHAVIGAEGAMPGDLELTVSKLDYWGPYTDPVNDELLRAVAPGKVRTIWWGYGGEKMAYPLWKPLLTGVANGHAWYSATVEAISGFLAADFTVPEYYRTGRAPYVAALNRGPAQLMIATPLRKSPVAMLWSQASYTASAMDRRFFTPRDSSVPLTDYFYRKGIGFDWVTSRMLEKEGLAGYRVLILPGASALSEKEVATITQFAQNGGVVIADLNPGVLNASCRPLEASQLAGLFGVSGLKGSAELEMKPVSIRASARGRTLTLEAAKALQSPEVPGFQICEVGKGLAILWNFNLSSVLNTATTSVDAFLGECLALASVIPEVRVEGISDEQMILRIREGAGFDVVGLLAGYPNVGKTARLQLPKKRWVYEVDGGLVGETSEVEVSLDVPFHLYSCFPTKQAAPLLELEAKEVRPGGQVAFKPGALVEDAVYRLEVSNPKGEALRRHTAIFTGRSGVAPLRFALNDTPGVYRVRLTDVRTGLHSEASLHLQPNQP